MTYVHHAEESALACIEPGLYVAEFVGYEETVTAFGDALRLKFALVDDPETTLSILCNRRGTENSKLTRFILSLCGKTFSQLKNHPVNLDDLIGNRAVAVVESIERDGRTYSNITRLSPMRTGAARPSAKPAPVEADEIPF